MKRIKNANGTGSITKTTKRKPYRVRVTDWRTKKRVSLGYYETRKQAMEVLNEYLYNPYDVENSTMTFKGLYRLFIENQKGLVADGTIKGYENSFKRCKPLHSLVFREIKGPQMQDTVNSLNCSVATKKITKNFLTVLSNYAMELEIMTVNRAKFIRLPKEGVKRQKNVFTGYEIQKPWNNIGIQWVDYILIMIYTGMRIGEVPNIRKENIDFINRIIRNIGNKTEKSKHRIIPIHSDILVVIEELYNISHTDYLICVEASTKNEPIHKETIRRNFNKIMISLGMKHIPHDTRRTLASILDKNKISETVIMDIMGHTDFKTTKEAYIINGEKVITEAMDGIKIIN